MGIKTVVGEVLEGAFQMVNWIASQLATDNDVEARVDDGSGHDNTNASFSEVWSVAGIQSRPKDGSDSLGYAKALRVQLGDAVLVIATHDPRHVEPAQQGELVLHALGKDGSTRALMRLKPDGKIAIESLEVTISIPSAPIVKGIANGDALKVFADAYMGAAPVANDGGAAIQTAVKAAMASAGYAIGSASQHVASPHKAEF